MGTSPTTSLCLTYKNQKILGLGAFAEVAIIISWTSTSLVVPVACVETILFVRPKPPSSGSLYSTQWRFQATVTTLSIH